MNVSVRSLLFLTGAVLTAQVVAPGPQVLTFLSNIDDSDQPYAIYVPQDYTKSKQWPLVISLHGEDSNHRLNLRRVFGQGNRPGESDVQATRLFPHLGDVDFIVASPLARGTMGYQGIAEKDVLDVLAEVKKQFSIDEDRVYLTGLSMGGGGALWLGLTRPDLWAGIAAVCPAPPEGLEGLAGNALNIPVKLFQGDIDPLVPAAQTRAWNKRFLDAGVKSEYVEYKSVRHNAWDQAYRNRAIFDWFRPLKRVSRPNRVRFATDAYTRASAYWLRFDQFAAGIPARADAEFEGNRLIIRTAELSAFTVDASRAPARPAIVEIDGTPIRIRPNTALSFHRGAKGWVQGLSRPARGDKQPGAEGPIADAISSRHIYLYGSLDSASPEELIRRRDIARRAAEWSSSQHRLQLSLRALSDQEAKPLDLEGANLILFGTRATNSRIAEIADRLPMHLNPGAADYGLVYVYPVGDRYVVISSGLPWWTRMDQARRAGLPLTAPPWRALQSFGDFILFRGGLDNVIVEGRFDQHWKPAPAALAALKATGALEIKGQ